MITKILLRIQIKRIYTLIHKCPNRVLGHLLEFYIIQKENYSTGGMTRTCPGYILSGCVSIGLFASNIMLYLLASP